MSDEPLPSLEECQKAKFISDYKELCKLYGMVVVQLHSAEGFQPYVVGETYDYPDAVEHQCTEMAITRTVVLRPPKK